MMNANEMGKLNSSSMSISVGAGVVGVPIVGCAVRCADGVVAELLLMLLLLLLAVAVAVASTFGSDSMSGTSFVMTLGRRNVAIS